MATSLLYGLGGYPLAVARFLALTQHLGMHLVDGLVNSGKQIGMFGFTRDFVMTPGHFYLDLIGAVLMPEKNMRLGLTCSCIEQLPDLGELRLKLYRLGRSQNYVASGVSNLHLASV
jgi:hypothetical protein